MLRVYFIFMLEFGSFWPNLAVINIFLFGKNKLMTVVAYDKLPCALYY